MPISHTKAQRAQRKGSEDKSGRTKKIMTGPDRTADVRSVISGGCALSEPVIIRKDVMIRSKFQNLLLKNSRFPDRGTYFLLGESS